ncbi:inositol 2-dehydrogenase [Acetatifactor muris]|uniref:Inositol 2-dehydrogenase n=1 Tax=Acetatifactor muris TaxID=879566 RepID=A0A2K4ZQ28_9FIRM|nr:inositol 2-dehydrogenase [Acetatifactor muris]MCI8798362.1 inositol 2-dehydrogenase [Lachnospiraceae bacterium]MCR2051025.1 inositol 2-dehydrogenase [Acetatifactor muris]SOY32567.1 Inositol 2-dehydrogenase [Acetatifactor muris]
MIRIGIIGAGRIGKVHLESITYHVKNAVVKAMADPFMNEETEKFIRGMGVEKIYQDYKKILEDPEIDAVLICSSTDTHASISIEAIEAGKNVFCEKPVDHALDKIKAVEDALAAHPECKFQVGFNRRFDHNFAAVRKAYDEGKIGEAHILKITSRDPEPPNPAYIKVSGGMFLDMTIHDFDMACFLTNSDVEEVYVQSAVLVDPAIGEQGDVDTAIITMKMANGALAVIDNSRRAAYGYDQRAELFGSKGMVATSNDTLSSAVISNAEGVTGEKPLFFFLERYMESFSEEMRQFVNACENGGQVPVGIHAGMQSVKIGLAAKKSVEEHRPVKISEL